MSVAPNLCCDETKNRGTYTRVTDTREQNPLVWLWTHKNIHNLKVESYALWNENISCHINKQETSQLSGVSGLQMWMYCAVLSHSVVSDSLRPRGLSPARLLSPWGSPGKKLEWVAMPSSRASSQPSDPIHVYCVDRLFLYHLSHQGSPIYVYTCMYIFGHASRFVGS